MIGVQVCLDEEAMEFADGIEYYALNEIRMVIWRPDKADEEE